MTVSIIVPAYNAQSYISECLDSICQQTYSDIELIVVDDGSADDTCSVAQGYMGRVKSGKVLTQKNAGVSAARNHGLSVATGEYVMFIDSDDKVDPTLVAKAITRAKSSDAQLTIFGFNEWYAEKNVWIPREMCEEPSLQNGTFSLRDIPCLSTSLVTPNSVRFLYKRSFLDGNYLRFCEELTSAEDLLFVYQVLLKAQSITLLNHRLYDYRRDVASSLTHGVRGNCSLRALSKIADTIAEMGAQDDVLMRHFVNLVLDTAQYSLASIANADEYFRYFEEFQRDWMPLVEENQFLVDDRYAHFFQTMTANDPARHLFDLFFEERGKSERFRVDFLNASHCFDVERQNSARAREEAQAVRSSHSYKIGNALVSLPSKAKRVPSVVKRRIKK